MKLLSKFMHILGTMVIVLTSVMGIVLGLFLKDLDNTYFQKPVEFLTSLESQFFDYRSKALHPKYQADDNLVLIKIDDESLKNIQAWPIPREKWAKMLDNLTEFGAQNIVFDVLFPEPAKSCGETSPDDIFADSIRHFQKNRGDVILAYSVQQESYKSDLVDENLMPEPPFELLNSLQTFQIDENCKNPIKRRVEKHNWPIQTYVDAEPMLGYLNMQEDHDGVFRHYAMYAYMYSKEMEGAFLFPSLGLRAFLSSVDSSDLTIRVDDQCLGSMEVDGKRINTNIYGETKIRWIGDADKFKSISLFRVIEGKNFEKEEKYYDNKGNVKVKKTPINLKEFFEGKTVFIGSTALGAHDFRNTPVDAKLPGVYAHMSFVNMLQNKFFYQDSGVSILYSLGFLFIGMLIIIITMLFNKAILDIIMLVTIIAVSYYLDYTYFLPKGYELKLFYCYFAFVATYSWITFLNFNQASAEKKQIKGAFSRYVAPSIVNDMLDNPDKLKVGGEKRDITCMFSDVRDFTSISEQLTATELAMALNRYMGEMTDIVFETNGTLDKYIGDAIVAFWGAPIDIGDHVNQALDAAVKMLEALPAINEEFKQKNLPEFKVGLGLNSGECSVGNMGSDQIFAYTALGDNMNLGARLESLCKYYGAQILISEYTYERMDQNKFTSRLIDNVIVKGKTEPVGVYEVLYSYHPFIQDKEALEEFKSAFDLFLAGEFQQAKSIFVKLVQKHPDDKASNRMLETCQHWIENPPKEGEDFRVTTMKTKG